MKNTTRYVGLDVHKDTIAVAFCDSELSKVENFGVIENSEVGLPTLADCGLVNLYASSYLRLSQSSTHQLRKSGIVVPW